MALKLEDISGNPYIGVFCRIVGDLAICPTEASGDFMDSLDEYLGLKGIRASLGNTNLHGSLIGANSSGFIIPYFYDLDEMKRVISTVDSDLADHLQGAVSDDPHTAWGNNILANGKAAMVNPDLSRDSIGMVEDVLDVEVVRGTIAGVKTLGSVAVMNGNGMVVHPKITEDEKERLGEVFSIDVDISTVNFGSPYIGAGLIANDRGAILGNKTSGVEMNRVENILDLID